MAIPTKPSFPGIAFGGRYCMLLFRSEKTRAIGTYSAFRNGFWDTLELYDVLGYCWKAKSSELHEVSTRARLMALLFNRMVSVSVHFGSPKKYEMDALIGKVSAHLRSDRVFNERFADLNRLLSEVAGLREAGDLIDRLSSDFFSSRDAFLEENNGGRSEEVY